MTVQNIQIQSSLQIPELFLFLLFKSCGKQQDWTWRSNTLATWCEELTHLKIPWCWERLKAGGEGDGREWDGWMASPTQWTWVWVSSGSRWWTGKPGVLQSMGWQRVGYDWVTGLNWTDTFNAKIWWATVIVEKIGKIISTGYSDPIAMWKRHRQLT